MKIGAFWGMTETVIHATRADFQQTYPNGSMGKPTPGYEFLIVDPETGAVTLTRVNEHAVVLPLNLVEAVARRVQIAVVIGGQHGDRENLQVRSGAGLDRGTLVGYHEADYKPMSFDVPGAARPADTSGTAAGQDDAGRRHRRSGRRRHRLQPQSQDWND